MFKTMLAAALALTVSIISNPVHAHGGGIHIFESIYGRPGRGIDVTDIVAERCEGRYYCGFPVRNEFFGADPIFDVEKAVVVYWTCGGGGRIRSTYPQGSFARLSC